MTHPIDNIARFMALGGQYFPSDTDHEITWEQAEDFLDRIVEEVNETSDAIYFHPEGGRYSDIQIPEALDGAIDIAYVALTLAIRLVGPKKAAQAWDAVVDANLSKVDWRFGDPIIDPETGKIGKPEGWIAPDIKKIVEA